MAGAAANYLQQQLVLVQVQVPAAKSVSDALATMSISRLSLISMCKVLMFYPFMMGWNCGKLLAAATGAGAGAGACGKVGQRGGRDHVDFLGIIDFDVQSAHFFVLYVKIASVS